MATKKTVKGTGQPVDAPMVKKAAPEKATRPVPEKKREFKIEMNAKLANPEGILKSYDQLIDKLAEAESAQRNIGKPYRIYFTHRKRMQVMKMNFVKSMR